MDSGAKTPEELETLLEDAVVLRDATALARLFEVGGVLVAGHAPARGRAEIGRVAPHLWLRRAGYLAGARQVLQVRDVALLVGDGSVNVARRGRGRGRSWRFVIAVLSDDTAAAPEKEKQMHTMVVTLSLDTARGPEVIRHFEDDIVPWAKNQPGFVTGQWLRTAAGDRGMGVLVFESAEAANAAAEGPRNYRPDTPTAWTIEGVELYEQVASA